MRNVVLLLSCLVSLPVFAKDSLELSLKDAIALALSDGVTAKLARLDLEAARYEGRRALSELLPQARAAYTQSNQIVNLKAYGFAQPGSPSLVGPFDVYDFHLDAALKVIDLAAIERYRAARKTTRASRYAEEASMHDTAAAVATLYVAEKRANSEVKETATTLRLFEKIKTLREHQLEVGLATRLDVHRAEFTRSSQEQVLLAAEERETSTRLALLHALGAPLDTTISLTDALEKQNGPLPSLDEALAQAERERPEIGEAKALLAAAKSDRNSRVAAHLPSVEAQFRGGYNGDDIDTLAWNRVIAGTVSVPLFAGGKITAERKRAEIEKRRAEILFSERKRQVEEEVRNAHLRYTTSKRHLKAAEENDILAHEELELALNRLRNGLASGLDVDHAQTAVMSAADTKIEALAHQATAWIEFCRATGEIREWLPTR